ncbi:MAG: MmgE/PrpD family protein, partial [Alphaproteobacteria bacterium]
PVVDASLEIARRPGFKASDVARIELRGHPLLRQRTDRPDVRTGRESQVSAQHAIAIVFRRGEAGLDAFGDAAVGETLAAGRPEIVFVDDASFDIAAVAMAVTMRDGAVHTLDIAAARGSEANPMSDAEIETKLATLADRAKFPRDVRPLIDAVWALEDIADAGDIARLAALED